MKKNALIEHLKAVRGNPEVRVHNDKGGYLPIRTVRQWAKGTAFGSNSTYLLSVGQATNFPRNCPAVRPKRKRAR